MFPSNFKKEEEKTEVTDISSASAAEELDGNLKFQDVEDKLMHSVLENDKQTIDEGMVIQEAVNRGMGAFTPDVMFEQMVQNYTMAKKIYGEALIRAISGYDPEYIEKNAGIPEFQRELKKKIEDKMEKFKSDKVLDKHGMITEKGIELASLVLYAKELDNVVAKGIRGERFHKKYDMYGDKMDERTYKKGDRYKDVSVKKSVKTAIRRGHTKLQVGDLKVFNRQSKGEVCMIYGLDSSGSMKGDKIGVCKKAGVSLAYKAIQGKDRVGLVVFGTEVIAEVPPTKNFGMLLNAITRVKAAAETDMAGTIKRAIEMFPNENITKHLLLLTDALPTKGENPEKATIEAASEARGAGISISIIGINMDNKGRKLAEKIVEIGNGKMYTVSELDEVGKIVLEDYYRVA